MTGLKVQWKSSPVDYTIDRNTVHIWRSHFQTAFVSNRKFLEGLSGEEIGKARRFVHQSDQNRYIFAHAMLRSILGAYVGCEPQQLIFETNQYGKPFLASPGDGNDIQFNLSHSEDMTLFAVTRGARVGIDVEYMRSVPDARQIVNRFFSVDERKFLNPLPLVDFNKSFFACWTSKEAYLKGIGKGLSYPLDKFSIIFPNRGSDGLICIQDDQVNAYSWKIIRLSPGPCYSGALAIEDIKSEPKFFQYC